jgi:hypothetical protein
MAEKDIKKVAFELGKRTGGQPAFDLVAKRCTAAAAEMLKSPPGRMKKARRAAIFGWVERAIFQPK